jgi:hypothetical protein
MFLYLLIQGEERLLLLLSGFVSLAVVDAENTAISANLPLPNEALLFD